MKRPGRLAANIEILMRFSGDGPPPSAWRTCLPLASPLVLFSHASFTRLAELGVLDAEFGRRIARAAGLRNRLVHEYEDIDPRRVFDALQSAFEDLPIYLRRVDEFVTRNST